METKFLHNTKILHPQWITGFTDAEGCFSIIIEIPKSLKPKVRTSFEINLHEKDINILYDINDFLKVGSVYHTPSRSRCVYRVTKIEELINVIIPFFIRYPLCSKKRIDFILWSKVVYMINDKKHLSFEGFSTILCYYAAINNGVSSKVAQYYPNIEAVSRPVFKLPEILNPYWVSGFTAGDGGFSINIRSNKKIGLIFHIAQHSKDIDLMNSLIKFFGTGKVYLRSNLSTPRCDFVIQNLTDITTKVINHFDNYPLNNIKTLDYNDFKQAVLLIKSGKHLSVEGFNQILMLKNAMNASRK